VSEDDKSFYKDIYKELRTTFIVLILVWLFLFCLCSVTGFITLSNFVSVGFTLFLPFAAVGALGIYAYGIEQGKKQIKEWRQREEEEKERQERQKIEEKEQIEKYGLFGKRDTLPIEGHPEFVSNIERVIEEAKDRAPHRYEEAIKYFPKAKYEPSSEYDGRSDGLFSIDGTGNIPTGGGYYKVKYICTPAKLFLARSGILCSNSLFK
jgi:hypothetical protein